MNSQAPNNNKTCPRCGKTTQGTSGSITQWISGCKCAELSELQYNAPKTCATCGKNIESGRPGSLTQWVFRQYICSCRIGGLGLPAQLQEDSNHSQVEEEPVVFPEEIEISVDSNKLPLDRYAPLAELGRGASGTVYLCRDRLLGAKVAVKCLNYLTGQQLLSFQQEAKATFKLTHPNIVKVINFDVTEAGSPYMVMEYFASVSLADLISERGALNWSELSVIFPQIVEGLAYAHKNEIFHRDLKPSNILLQQSGSAPRIRIIDFGVALVKNVEGGAAINQGETLVGTPEYMSPDQAAGIAYDERSEIYSLGCLSFEAATGRKPFQGSTAIELINQHAHASPPLISDFSENQFPPELVSLIDRMLAKNPSDRPQSMVEVKKEFVEIENLSADTDTESSSSVEAETKSSTDKPKKIAPAAILVPTVITALSCLAACFFLISQTQQSEESRTSSSTPHTSSAVDLAHVYKKFKMDRVDFDGLNNTRFVLTSSGDQQVTDEDLKCVQAIMDPASVGINLGSFKGVKGEGIKYLVDSKIKCVAMQGAKLDPIGYENLARIKSLEELQLYGSNITDRDLEHFRHHPNIRLLVLGRCEGISDKALEAVATIPNLTSVDLTNSTITDDGLKALSQCTSLNSISLEATRISDEGLKNLTSWPALRGINLTQCAVSGESLRLIMKRWPGLAFLEIGGNGKLKPSDLECLRNSQLTELDIVGIPISDKELQVISTIKPLNSIHISKSTLSNDGLKYLYPLKNLWSISILGTKFPKEKIEQLKKVVGPGCGVIIPSDESSPLPDILTDMYSAASKAQESNSNEQ